MRASAASARCAVRIQSGALIPGDWESARRISFTWLIALFIVSFAVAPAVPFASSSCHVLWAKTRGVSANQVFAGISATLRMLNMKLHQRRSVLSQVKQQAI